MPGARWMVFDTNVYVAALREGLDGASFAPLEEAAPRTFLASVVSAELRAGALDEAGRRVVTALGKRFERVGRIVRHPPGHGTTPAMSSPGSRAGSPPSGQRYRGSGTTR